MGKQTLTITSKMILTALIAGDLVLGLRGRVIDRVYHPWLDPDRHLKRMLWYLYKHGLITWEDKEGKRLVKLTRQGKLKTLLEQFDVDKLNKWDGKWRVVVYDIPQSAGEYRFQLMYQLKRLTFKKLQGSVYVSPYAFNEAAMEYLKTSGLMPFIRIMTVERMDNDEDLRQKFNLS